MTRSRFSTVLGKLVANIEKEDIAKGVAVLATQLAQHSDQKGLQRAVALVAEVLDLQAEPDVRHFEKPDPQPAPRTHSRAQAATTRDTRTETTTSVMRGLVDTINCGDFSFTRYNVQLIVSMLGTDGKVGGEYDLSTFPMRRWAGLVGRDQRKLAVQIFRDDDLLGIRVGDVSTQHHMMYPTR